MVAVGYLEVINMRKEHSKPCVIVVSGPMGSGKTAVVRRLVELMGGAPALIFDHYDQYAEWPQDMDRWIQTGADPNQVRVPRLKEDLLSLLEGASITHPLDDTIVNPSEYILLEDPFGQERQEIAEYIDRVVYVDVPPDVSVVRIVQRALGITGADFEKTIESESREDLVKRLKAGAFWLTHYMWIRSGLGLLDIIKQKADIVVDGMEPVDKVAQKVLGAIENLQRHS
jgi:uridine kinase